MTEKRYSYSKSEFTGLYVISDEKHRETFSGMDNEYNCNRIVRILNMKEEENEQLKQQNKMLSMKMSEVSTKYRLLKKFSEDTNPNDAVEKVLSELMMITKEYR